MGNSTQSLRHDFQLPCIAHIHCVKGVKTGAEKFCQSTNFFFACSVFLVVPTTVLIATPVKDFHCECYIETKKVSVHIQSFQIFVTVRARLLIFTSFLIPYLEMSESLIYSHFLEQYVATISYIGKSFTITTLYIYAL